MEAGLALSAVSGHRHSYRWLPNRFVDFLLCLLPN